MLYVKNFKTILSVRSKRATYLCRQLKGGGMEILMTFESWQTISEYRNRNDFKFEGGTDYETVSGCRQIL